MENTKTYSGATKWSRNESAEWSRKDIGASVRTTKGPSLEKSERN